MPPPAHSDVHARRAPAAVAETDAETDAEMSELESELESELKLQLGAGTAASDEGTVVSDEGSDWEGDGGDVANLEDVAKATWQRAGERGGAAAHRLEHEPAAAVSSDLSAAQASFLGTLDLRARTPRTLLSTQAGTLSVKVPICKSRLGLRDFLRSSASARPGALAGRMKARAQEVRLQAQYAQQKEAKAQGKEEARLAAETQRRARAEAARVVAEDAAAAREFDATMRLGAKVEVAQARGGSVSVWTRTDPLKIHIKQFVKPIRIRLGASSAVEAATCNWVACDACRKWRRLPAGAALPAEDEPWRCEMNVADAPRSTCEAAEETEAEAAKAEASAGLPAMQLELEQMRATARVVGAQYKTALNVKTVRFKLAGEGTLVRERLVMPAAPPKRAVASQGRAAGGTRAAEAKYPYGKAFNVRERRGTRAAFAVAGVPPLALTPALPPLPLLPNAAAGPFSAAAAAKAGDFAPPMPAPPSAAGEL